MELQLSRSTRYAILLCAFLVVVLLAAGGPAGWSQSFFWEEPQVLISSGARFPAAVSGGGLVAVVWQEMERAADGGGDIYLSIRTSRDLRLWKTNRRFFGPVSYPEREVAVFSLVVDRRGTIFLAIAAGETETKILRSTDEGATFELLSVIDTAVANLAPYLSLTDGGNMLLFVTQERETFLSSYYAVSRDGRTWSPFQPLVEGGGLPINFLPAHVSRAGREYVVFQAWPRGTVEQIAYQLYLTYSEDGGYTWSAPRRLLLTESIPEEQFEAGISTNQRPFLSVLDGDLAVVWERQRGASPPQIYFARIRPDGTVVGEAEAVTQGQGAAHFPRIVNLGGKTLLFWFDSRRGEDHIFFAEKKGIRWEETDLSDMAGASIFAYPVEVHAQLYVFWENRVGNNSRLVFLAPDQTVSPPVVRPVGFDPARPSRRDTVQIEWTLPQDPSGLAGVDYLWTQNPGEPLARELRLLTEPTFVQLEADRDGTWFFRLAVQDYAGNWSEPRTVRYIRDTTPPARPTVLPPETDDAGFVYANTFTVQWRAPESEEPIAGYSYSLVYLGSSGTEQQAAEPKLSPQVLTKVPQALSYNNLDDGLWAFSVSALDTAGNLSEPDTVLLRLNKYIPVTYISSVKTQSDALGSLSVNIGGRGFSEGGLVNHVILDQDGAPPYDYSFPLDQGSYEVVSDRLIRGLTLVDIEEGLYRVGVVHPTRGTAFTAPVLRIESPGTVKFGDFSFVYRPWHSVHLAARSITAGNLVLLLVLVFLAGALLVSARKLAGIAQESRLLRHEVLAVLRGEVSVARKEEKMEELRRRGVSLRVKFTLLVMILVLIVVLMVSISLGLFMIQRQRQSLTEGFRQRTEILLGSIASSAENSLPIQDRIELGLLPDQIASMEEAEYVTITGEGVNDPEHFDYVWASNDANINEKLQGGAFNQETVGEVRIEDDLSPLLADLQRRVNNAARQRVAGLAEEINRLSAEARQLALRSRTDVEAQRQLQLIQQQIGTLDSQILQELREIGSETVSFPRFDPQQLLPFYIFYRPVVYRQPGQDIYFRGAVRLGVSTEKIRSELAASQRNLIFRTGIIALIAAGLGLLGAILMAAITINPINKLVAGVAVIRDTEDKEELREHVIDVRSKDEIGMLATTVNQMTQALVKAAIASKDLTVGKEVQKMFIPLAPDAKGGKGTTGGEEDDNIEIFGFYEGAKGVSGDYFDYRKLTDQYYAVILCDVAGKGVPAALIMVEVATIFSTYFRNWTPKSPGLKIDQLAYLINDLVEERGFKGRFAALALAIVNSATGKSYFVNAGLLAKLHVYRAAEGKLVIHKLPESPATGVFPSDLLKMQAGFKLVAQQLQAGDTVFLFTDGIEEAKRLFRNERFQPVVCDEPDLEENQEHGGTHLKGSNNEELGLHRIYEIINSVFNRRIFTLIKYHNPVANEELTFDFSSCQGSVEEAVLAMVAVEKVFRLYPDPAATVEDRVIVDKNIDGFLKKHFDQYARYFKAPLAGEENGSTVTYTQLKEDEQYDDLTVLAIRKK
jgi:hypothetical protein